MRDILALILGILLAISVIVIAYQNNLIQQPTVVTKYINSPVNNITKPVVMGHKCAIVTNIGKKIQINVMDCASISTHGAPIKVITVS